jgi:hypothetical protein
VMHRGRGRGLGRGRRPLALGPFDPGMPNGRISRISRMCRRNPVIASLSAVVALLSLAIGATTLIGLRSSEFQGRRAERGGALAHSRRDGTAREGSPPRAGA